MGYVQIDVNVRDIISEVSSEDLINALEQCSLDTEDIAALRELIKDGGDIEVILPNENLDDVMKTDHLQKIWSKYSAADFERLLP